MAGAQNLGMLFAGRMFLGLGSCESLDSTLVTIY